MSDSDINDPPPPPATPGLPFLPDPPATPSAEPVPTAAPPSPPSFAPPPPPPPSTPEPIFIAEQTPIPAAPTTTELPTVAMASTPMSSTGPLAGGEPTSVIPPVAAAVPMVASNVPPPGGPGGPLGPDADEPDKPWYKKPGAIVVILIVLALLLGLIAWLFSSGDDDDDGSIVPAPTETSTTTTLVADETTTIAPETTVELTTTLAPETTAAPETTEAPETTVEPTTTDGPATTTTIPEIIPEPGETIWDVIEREPELSELQRLLELSGLAPSLQDPGSIYTLFAPTNDAITAALEDLGDPEDIDQEVLQNILLAHLNNVEAVDQADLITLNQIAVMFGGPQQIDGGTKPPTIGGAKILVQAAPTTNGILYAIDKVLQPVAD